MAHGCDRGVVGHLPADLSKLPFWVRRHARRAVPTPPWTRPCGSRCNDGPLPDAAARALGEAAASPRRQILPATDPHGLSETPDGLSAQCAAKAARLSGPAPGPTGKSALCSPSPLSPPGIGDQTARACDASGRPPLARGGLHVGAQGPAGFVVVRGPWHRPPSASVQPLWLGSFGGRRRRPLGPTGPASATRGLNTPGRRGDGARDGACPASAPDPRKPKGITASSPPERWREWDSNLSRRNGGEPCPGGRRGPQPPLAEALSEGECPDAPYGGVNRHAAAYFAFNGESQANKVSDEFRF
jgi:hypothetical protein